MQPLRRAGIFERRSGSGLMKFDCNKRSIENQNHRFTGGFLISF